MSRKDKDDLPSNPRRGRGSDLASARSREEKEAGPSRRPSTAMQGPPMSTRPLGAEALPLAGQAFAQAGSPHARTRWPSYLLAAPRGGEESSEDELLLHQGNSESDSDGVSLLNKATYDWTFETDSPLLDSDVSRDALDKTMRPVNLASEANTGQAASLHSPLKIHLVGSFHGKKTSFPPEETRTGFIRDEESKIDMPFELQISISEMLMYPLDCMLTNCDVFIADDTTSPTSDEISKDDSATIFLYSSVLAYLISPQKMRINLYTDNAADMGDFVGRFFQRHIDLTTEFPPNIFQSSSQLGAWAASLKVHSGLSRVGASLQIFFSTVHLFIKRIFDYDNVTGNMKKLDEYFERMNLQVRLELDDIAIKVPHACMDVLGRGVLTNLREFIKALRRDPETFMNEFARLKQTVWRYVISAKTAQDIILRLPNHPIPREVQELFFWSNRVCQAMFLCAFPRPPPPKLYLDCPKASTR